MHQVLGQLFKKGEKQVGNPIRIPHEGLRELPSSKKIKDFSPCLGIVAAALLLVERDAWTVSSCSIYSEVK